MVAFGRFMVLGPLISERELGGAAAWAAVVVGPAAAFLGERTLLALAAVVVIALAAATVARRDVRELRQPGGPPPHGPGKTAAVSGSGV